MFILFYFCVVYSFESYVGRCKIKWTERPGSALNPKTSIHFFLQFGLKPIEEKKFGRSSSRCSSFQAKIFFAALQVAVGRLAKAELESENIKKRVGRGGGSVHLNFVPS